MNPLSTLLHHSKGSVKSRKSKLVCQVMSLLLLMSLISCKTTKDVVYLQDVVPYKATDIEQKFEVLIHEDDLLGILVNSKDKELVVPFNMPMVSYQIGSESYGQQRLLGYLVDVNGDIDFPVLGKIHVVGLTRLQLKEMIKKRLIDEDLVKDPVVTVQFLNYKVSVIGEVARPGSFTIAGDRITLLEALSMAGDLTIYGRRDRVAVIREKDGKKLTVRWLTYPSRQELPLLAESAQATLKDIGIDLDINCTADNNSIADDPTAWDVYAMANVQAPTGDPEYWFTVFATSDATRNQGKYSSEKLDDLEKELSAEFDIEKRAELAVQMQQTVLDDHAFVFCSFLKMSMISKANVTGYESHACDYYQVTADLDIN